MGDTLTSRTLHRLDVQGFDAVGRKRLAEVAPWLRLTFGPPRPREAPAHPHGTS